jgi:hypothetical protein
LPFLLDFFEPLLALRERVLFAAPFLVAFLVAPFEEEAEEEDRRAFARLVVFPFEDDFRADTRLRSPFVAFVERFLLLVAFVRAFVAILTSRALLPESTPE